MKPSKEERKLIEARSKKLPSRKRYAEIDEMVYEMPDGKYRETFLDLLAYIKHLAEHGDQW